MLYKYIYILQLTYIYIIIDIISPNDQTARSWDSTYVTILTNKNSTKKHGPIIQWSTCQVLEFMEDFASSLGLTISQRERLLQQLGVEDQELLDAKQLAPWAGETPQFGPRKKLLVWPRKMDETWRWKCSFHRGKKMEKWDDVWWTWGLTMFYRWTWGFKMGRNEGFSK